MFSQEKIISLINDIILKNCIVHWKRQVLILSVICNLSITGQSRNVDMT